MSKRSSVLVPILVVILTAILAGCDTSAERELRRAEQSLDMAQQYGAEQYATEDYMAAQELLVEADQLARENRIQEARSLAVKAKLRADDALRKAKEYQKILEEEEDRLYR